MATRCVGEDEYSVARFQHCRCLRCLRELTISPDDLPTKHVRESERHSRCPLANVNIEVIHRHRENPQEHLVRGLPLHLYLIEMQNLRASEPVHDNRGSSHRRRPSPCFGNDSSGNPTSDGADQSAAREEVHAVMRQAPLAQGGISSHRGAVTEL